MNPLLEIAYREGVKRATEELKKDLDKALKARVGWRAIATPPAKLSIPRKVTP